MSEKQDYIINVKVDGLDTVVEMAASSAQQIIQAFSLVQDSLQQGAKMTKDTFSNILEQMDVAATQINNMYKDMSIDELSNEFVKLEENIKSQIAVLEQAQMKLEMYKASLQGVMKGGDGTASDEQFIELINSVNEAQAALDVLKEKKEQVADSAVKTTSDSNKSDDPSKKAENTKTTIDAITSLMDTIGEASGGAVQKIMSIGAAVLNLIPAFQAAGAAGATMGTMLNAALGVVGVIFTVIITIVNAITQAQAEAKQKMEEARKEIDSLRDNNIGAGRLISEFEILSEKTVKTADDMQRMNDIRAELVDSYGFSVGAIDEEGRLLAGNLNMMKEQLAISQQIAFTMLQGNEDAEISTYNEAIDTRKNQMQRIAQLQNEIIDLEVGLSAYGGPGGSLKIDHSEEIKAKQAEIDTLQNTLKFIPDDAQTAIDNLFQLIILETRKHKGEIPGAVQEVAKIKMEDVFLNNQDAAVAQQTAQDFLDLYFDISDKSKVESTLDEINNLKAQMIAAFANAGADSVNAGSEIDGILNAILGGDASNEKILTRMNDLKQRIFAGIASDEEMAEYDQLASTISQGFTNALLEADGAIQAGIPGAGQAKKVVGDLGKTYTLAAKEITSAAVKEKTAASSAKDLTDDTNKLRNSFDSLYKKASEAEGLKDAASILKSSAPDSKEYAKALEYVKDKGYGPMLNDMETAIPIIEADAQSLAEAATLENVELQGQGNLLAGAISQKLQEAKAAGDEKGIETYTTLSNWINAILKLFGNMSTMGVESEFKSVPLGGGGGGSKKNKALDREMEQLEHNKALGQVTTAEEIANLERILAKYAKTTDEKRDLTEKLYDLKKQLAEDELDYQKAMDQLTLREEIAAMDQMIATYKQGTSARRDLEKERYEAQRELERQEYDLKVYYGQMTLAEQEEQLKQMIASYKEGVEDRIDLEKELYDLQQTILQQNIDRLNGLSDAVVSALQARYEAQREAEEKTLNDSIDAWQVWGDEQVSAIQRQIDALDELTKQENDAEEEANKRRKISMLEQQLQYEQDIYNRRKLQEELSKAQEELDDWLVEKEREALKASLEQQIENVNNTVTNEQDKLQEKIDANNEYYDNLLKDQNLQEEARRLLMQSGQDDIINLLKAYAPEYNATGQTLGDQLVDGFLQRVGDIDQWFAGLTASLAVSQQQLAAVATMAADQFYATHGIPSVGIPETMAAQNITKVGPTFNVYFTEPKEYTPSEINAEIERLAERLADLE